MNNYGIRYFFLIHRLLFSLACWLKINCVFVMPVNSSVIDANTVVCFELMYRQITRVFYQKISRYKIKLILPKKLSEIICFSLQNRLGCINDA